MKHGSGSSHGSRGFIPAREPAILAFLLIEIQLRLTVTGKTVKSSIPKVFELVPVRSGLHFFSANLSGRTALNLKATFGSPEVMIFDNLVVDNKRWHLSNSMLFGRSDSLRGQIGETASKRIARLHHS